MLNKGSPLQLLKNLTFFIFSPELEIFGNRYALTLAFASQKLLSNHNHSQDHHALPSKTNMAASLFCSK